MRLKSAIHAFYLAACRYPAMLFFKLKLYSALKYYLQWISQLPKTAGAMRVLEFYDIKAEPFNHVLYEGAENINIWTPTAKGAAECLSLSSIPVYAFMLRNATVFPASHLVAVGGRAYIDSFPCSSHAKNNRIRYDDRSILIHDAQRMIVRNPAGTKRIARGIHLLDSGGHNYFHFMIELLPKLLLLKEKAPAYAGWPLIVAASWRANENFKEVLRHAGFENLLFLEEEEGLTAGELLYISKLWNMPFNLKYGHFEISDLRYHPALFRLYDAFIEGLPPGHAGAEGMPGRILLSRANTGQRKYNDKEIEGIAAAHGFEIVDAGKLSFIGQFHLFRNAECIVGPTGASWTNLIFASAGTRALCWMSELWGEFPAFSTLAAMRGVELQYIIFPPGSAKEPHHDYYLDPEIFERRLLKLLNRPAGSKNEKISAHE